MLIALILSACATTPVTEVPAVGPVVTDTGSAAALLERARSAEEPEASTLYLQAGLAFLEEGMRTNAILAQGSIEPGWLEAEALPRYALLTAAVATDLTRAQSALEQVPAAYRELPLYAQAVANVCWLEGDAECALAYLVDGAGGDPAQNEIIWSLLNATVSMETLKAAPAAPSTELRAWQDLHRAAVTAFSLEDAAMAARRWEEANPAHPASLLPPAAIVALADRPESLRIALMVPVSGPLSRAGEAVRDGFISAALLANALSKRTITVYDTAAEPIGSLYERALADGSDLVIGPLQKPAASALNALNPELPVLLLNYLDNNEVAAPNVRQLGLAIEDEAATIQARLAADGVRRALLFHNYDDWSLRARRVLTEAAAADSGHAPLNLTVQPFTDIRTITEAVGSAMHVAESDARKTELAALLRTELEFLPRAREDVDAVVALIDNGEANALVPALRFHFADDLPVYASSQTVRRTRSGALNTLAGFQVSELPWFLGDDPVHGAMAKPLGLEGNPFASLVALGTDAYRLSERLGPVPELPMLGSTGLLIPEQNGRFTRLLGWGVVVGDGMRAIGETGP
ncbi:MAG: penicillin-binding protein activator [Pseudomonadota bacterium]